MIAAAPITITSGRHKHIEFIKPFQHLGLAFVMKKPSLSVSANNFTVFSIFTPLAPEIWVTVVVSYVLVGALSIYLAQ